MILIVFSSGLMFPWGQPLMSIVMTPCAYSNGLFDHNNFLYLLCIGQARAAAARGDIAAANSFARSAKSMINYSICIGIITIIIIAVIMGVYFGLVVKQLYDLDDDYD